MSHDPRDRTWTESKNHSRNPGFSHKNPEVFGKFLISKSWVQPNLNPGRNRCSLSRAADLPPPYIGCMSVADPFPCQPICWSDQCYQIPSCPLLIKNDDFKWLIKQFIVFMQQYKITKIAIAHCSWSLVLFRHIVSDTVGEHHRRILEIWKISVG